MERTLILIKPDAVQRQLVGRILSRFEQKGLKIVAMKMLAVSDKVARKLYAEHKDRDFYEALVRFMTSSPVIAVVLEGKRVVTVARSMIGPTFGPHASAGTIRGDFGISERYNLVHSADSVESARNEIELFFSPDELLEYELGNDPWIYTRSDGEIS